MKPISLAPLIAIVLTGAGLGAYFAVAGAGSGEEATPAQPTATPTPTQPTSASPTPAPEAKGQLWRWVNVTVVIPEGSDVFVFRSVLPDDTRHGVEIMRDTDRSDITWSSVLIDAETGAIVREEVLPEDRAAIDQVLQTLRVSPLDRNTAPWPYSAELPADLPRETAGGMSVVRPDPASGIHLHGGLADPGGEFIGITNGRSTITLSVAAPDRLSADTMASVLPEDQAVFQRWLDAVKLCGAEVQC